MKIKTLKRLSLSLGALCVVLAASLVLVCIHLGPIRWRDEDFACPCQCRYCLWTPADRFLFFPKDKVYNIYMTINETTYEIPDYAEDEFIDVLNSFEPISAEYYDRLGGNGARINMLEYYRNLVIGRSSIAMGNTLYIGEEGCLQRLYDIAESGREVPKQ